ncbi:hypothetical protein DM01DRAFT_1338369 [Hesseltinella vesiculosa]|uniref:Type 1 phosphatases regulator n=1 Tax=Hesseltinella vesiculosa TaxID=101127 RepID=A0A1X2GAN5_9FUNG|nr:hypothetical protein DM01DRAFT_1338369 [Hesseltinella vesiculosa]
MAYQAGSQTRERTATPSHGSRTLALEESSVENSPSPSPDPSEIGVLRLRGDMSARRPPAVRWDSNVIDNEHMGKKKSKICCIYHKPKQVGESSDESDSSSSSSSDSENDSHNEADGQHDHHRHCRHRKKKKDPRSVSPNAYERQPVYKTRPNGTPSTSK